MSQVDDPPTTSAPGGEHGLRHAVRDGVVDVTPMVIGVVPFALAIGTAIGASTLSTAQGLVSAPTIMAGSAQLTMVEMTTAEVAPLVIIASAIIINARLLLYSASLAPWFANRPRWMRFALAVPVVDQLYFTAAPRFARGDLDEAGRTAYFCGAAAWLVGAWVVAQAVAILVGATVPEWVGLDLAAPLALVGLVAKSVDTTPARIAAAVAGVTAVAAVGLPLNTAMLLAIIVGIAVGTWLQPNPARATTAKEAAQ
ncbi:MAG: AzlC family ABC transporter permease [Actinomycetota bacterium]